MAKHNKTEDLLRVLEQKTPSLVATPQAVPAATPAPSARQETKPPTLKADPPVGASQQAIRGKAIQFYLHDADEKLIRELAVWLMSNRKRINDSLVIKAVLRAAKTGPELLAAYDAAVQVDGRIRQKRQSQETT
jgi:hypothetical protein